MEDATSIRHWVVHLLTWQTPASALSNTASGGGTSTTSGTSTNNNNERNRKRSNTRPEYDPLAVFALELAVQMGVKHPSHLLMLW